MSDVIHLNVGGVKYSTTRETLTRYPDSMLGSMFSERLPSTRDENGRYFIDRNGKVFHYVLEFLRTGMVCVPDSQSEHNMLSREADFYQIQALVSALEKAQIETHILEVIEIKQKLRTSAHTTYPQAYNFGTSFLIGKKVLLQRLHQFYFHHNDTSCTYLCTPEPYGDSIEHPCAFQNAKPEDVLQIDTRSSTVRLKLAEFLHSKGCQLLSSSWMGYDKTRDSDTIRDQWLVNIDSIQ